jgi:hypothetical protein
MAFSTKFDSYVCEGDTITAQVDGFTVTACVVRDDSFEPPDARQDGFWPSLRPRDAGYIGEGKTEADLAKADRQAGRIMQAWRDDEWFYCGIVLSVSLAGITLDNHAASLWSIEANYPDSNNAYLTEIASELLPEAVDAARSALATLCAGSGFANAEAFA